MKKPDNLLTQPEVRSPSGTRSAKAFSIANKLLGNTQVMVDFGEGGGGVFSVDLPNVPIRLRWIDDSQLVLGYPEEVTPSKRAPRAYHAGQEVTIRYEPFPGEGARIAALEEEWGVSSLEERRTRLPPEKTGDIFVKGRKLRGRILQTSRTAFRYEYYDVNEPDSSRDQLTALGLQGGGETWAGIVLALIKLKRLRVLSKLRFDPEAEGLTIRSADRAALEKVAALVTEVKSDGELLKNAIAKARAMGELE